VIDCLEQVVEQSDPAVPALARFAATAQRNLALRGGPALRPAPTSPPATPDPPMKRFLPLVVDADGYLLGSIHSLGLGGRWWGGIDAAANWVRAPTGATKRALRQMGKGPALGGVFLLDVLKGKRAVVARQGPASSRSDQRQQRLGGWSPLAWPALGRPPLADWLGCKGGKAVATGLGYAARPWCRPWSWPLRPVPGHSDGQPDRLALARGWPPLTCRCLMQGSFMTAGTGMRPAYLALAVAHHRVWLCGGHRANRSGRLIAGTEPKLGKQIGAN